MSIRAIEPVNRKSAIANGGWLPDMDLNHDKQIQSLLCYRYTIGQKRASKVGFQPLESRTLTNVRTLKRLSVKTREAQRARQFNVLTLQRFNAPTTPRSHAPTI